MRHTESLKKNYQFRLVYNKGKSAADRLIVVYALRNREAGKNRLGLSVSKKVGKAVTRNRVRRLIRESYRIIEGGEIKKGYDIVVIARQAAAGAGFHEISASLSALLKRHNIV